MMRRNGWLAIVMAFCFLLAGCGSGSANTTVEAEKDSQTQTDVQTDAQTEAVGDSNTLEEGKEKDPSSAKIPSGSDAVAATATTAEIASEAAQAENGYPVFDFSSKTVKLNSGYEMPILGLGMFSLSDSQAENSTYWALKAGFRLIDTATIYGNEAAVGRGLRRAIDEEIVTREEVFITTKMWTSDFDKGDAAVDASLERLGVDYIDLMILHHSQPSNDVDAYQAMERAVEAGKLRSIGLSNYYEPEDFDRIGKG